MPDLHDLRRAKRLTQIAVADAVNVDESTVSKWERGVQPVPLKAVPLLAGILCVPMGTIVEAALASAPQNQEQP
jgi:transcriptional regulator with XRE-family HTH domain